MPKTKSKLQFTLISELSKLKFAFLKAGFNNTFKALDAAEKAYGKEYELQRNLLLQKLYKLSPWTLVAQKFDMDTQKTGKWFAKSNPKLLSFLPLNHKRSKSKSISPNDFLKIGATKKLKKFIVEEFYT